MQKLCYLGCFAMMAAMISCNTNSKHKKVSEPVGVVAQAVSDDTLITYYEGERPYKLNQQIDTRIKFVRNVHDTAGRFYLDEVYLNRKDSVKRHYQAEGNYRILPKPHGEAQGVALYNMVVDDKSKGYIYVLKDDVTLVRADEKGNEFKGEDAVVLKVQNKN
jgi:hypothetical protein